MGLIWVIHIVSVNLVKGLTRLTRLTAAAEFAYGDFYKLPFRKFRENIWKIVGGNEGAMRAL